MLLRYMRNEELTALLQKYVRDGGFLQSEEWAGFQSATGKRIFRFEVEGCFANVVEHTLPWVGKYWYVPRGPVVGKNDDQGVKDFFSGILDRARQEKIGWIRVDPSDNDVLETIRENVGVPIRKAPHDMQPKEILIMPIDGDERGILAQMKSKTRYNIRLAEKKSVRVSASRKREHIEAFCDLVEVTAKRDGIVSHPRGYYLKMLETIPEEVLRLYVAEYEGEIVAANLVVFFGEYATYLHGASGNAHREVMAPYLLQWRQMQDAHTQGCRYYDFGGVKSIISQQSTVNKEQPTKNSWAGITRFKQGFAPEQEPTRFPGSFDLVVDGRRYMIYTLLQRIKRWLR